MTATSPPGCPLQSGTLPRERQYTGGVQEKMNSYSSYLNANETKSGDARREAVIAPSTSLRSGARRLRIPCFSWALSGVARLEAAFHAAVTNASLGRPIVTESSNQVVFLPHNNEGDGALLLSPPCG